MKPFAPAWPALVLLAAAAASSPATAQHAAHDSCPMHAAHPASEVDRRGDQVMGFSHAATVHHFLLEQGGGAIEVAAQSPDDDAASIAAIRGHLVELAAALAEGDFAMPQAIHQTQPPGAETLASRLAELEYSYQETATGGRVRIVAKTPETLAAIHEFLRFQIHEHRTGDPLEPAP